MNEILQKRIEEEAKNYADSLALPEWDKRSIHAIDFKKGAVAALQNQWISVEEALPEVSEYDSDHVMSDHVFATDESLENVIVAWYDNGNKKWYQEWTGGEIVQFKITHWMPITELPKGGEK